MSYPTDPKTLQVLDRIIVVLEAVVAGTDFFYSAGPVLRGIVAYDTINSYPCDMVYLGPDSREPENLPDSLVRKYITVQVESYVDKLHEEDTVAALVKHLRDVEKAINDDTRPGAGTGSLGVLCVYANVGIAETDDGMLAGEGLAAFKLSILACIEGDWGTV